jgi:predicted RNA binding protein YcfA (HicA-like mRNA interferase family)
MRSREARDVCNKAKKQGWSIGKTRNGHLKLRPPNKNIVIIGPSTPSDWRAVKNLIAHMKRNGFIYHE